ncbi:ADP-ribosyltransferase [Clostridium tyrobutyricum]|uniref:ADP-ribosyltransferase n=2 Tax=Clostridium tyrobutyricum TaxID=1519 RepID=UPI001C386C68|nr:ADP-ribosyltransferase [Clostridium tyrobutyricum]
MAKLYKKVISYYCKEDQPQINRHLREGKELNEQQLKYMEALDKALSNKIGKNVIVYRNLKENPFMNKLTFTEKGYMSTSLIDGSISAIHNGKYMLKILLSSSCQGFYVDFISQRTGEYELLLKRNTKLKKLGYINQNDRMLILCKAECN